MSDKERDELAELIANTECPNLAPPWPERLDRSPVKWESRKTADVLIAAGYSKPRTITTAEELDALPQGVLILTEQGGYWESIKRADGLNWFKEPGAPGGGYLATSTDLALPATVLHEPAA